MLDENEEQSAGERDRRTMQTHPRKGGYTWMYNGETTWRTGASDDPPCSEGSVLVSTGQRSQS
eukprot:3066734-Amphidinium_carterae.1